MLYGRYTNLQLTASSTYDKVFEGVGLGLHSLPVQEGTCPHNTVLAHTTQYVPTSYCTCPHNRVLAHTTQYVPTSYCTCPHNTVLAHTRWTTMMRLLGYRVWCQDTTLGLNAACMYACTVLHILRKHTKHMYIQVYVQHQSYKTEHSTAVSLNFKNVHMNRNRCRLLQACPFSCSPQDSTQRYNVCT